MKPHSLGYLIKEGIKGLWKNRTMTIASIGVLISCLLLTGIASLLTLNLSVMMKTVEGTNSVTIFLEDTLPTLKSIQVQEELRKIDNIQDYDFISKDQGLASVIDSLGEHGELLEGMAGEENFLPDSYTVTMKDLSKYDETVSEIMAIDGVESITDYGDIADKLSNLDRLVRYVSIGVVLILAIVSLFIMTNTIKVTMYTRRTEINIMKSVGATNGFVRIPFLIEGILIGLISSIVSIVIIYFAYDKMVEIIYNVVPFLTAVDREQIMWIVVVGYLGIGLLFGLLGGSISIGRYLKREGEKAVV